MDVAPLPVPATALAALHAYLAASGVDLEDRLSGEQRDRFARDFAATRPEVERAWRDVMAHLAGKAGNGSGGGPL